MAQTPDNMRHLLASDLARPSGRESSRAVIMMSTKGIIKTPNLYRYRLQLMV